MNANNNNFNRGGRQANIQVQQRPVPLRTPSLRVCGTSPSAYFSKYHFQEEGSRIIKNYFENLIKSEEKPGQRFATGFQEHPHPVGATFRAYYHDLILYGYGKDSEMLDIGSSVVRMASRFDEPTAGVERPVVDRVRMTAPILSTRDVFRRQANLTSITGVPHVCSCEGGISKPGCANCDHPTPITTAIDSIYYDGVVEEIVKRSWLANFDHVSYVTFNDYHHAHIDNPKMKGRCADGESTYELVNKSAGLGHKAYAGVRVDVRGNIEPYIHKVIQTKGLSSWKVPMILDVSETIKNYPMAPRAFVDNNKLAVYVHFEVLDQVWNGDVPYKLCRVHVIPTLTYALLGGNQVPELDGLYLTDFNELSKNSDSVIDRLLITAPPTLSVHDIRIDTGYRNTPEYRQVMLDFQRMDETNKSYLRMWDTICFEASQLWSLHQSNERLYTTLGKDGKMYVTVEVYRRKFGVHWRNADLKARAPLNLVMKAYIALGNKKSVDAMNNACANFQKDVAETLGDGVLYATEAFLIARIIRGQQQARANVFYTHANSLSH